MIERIYRRFKPMDGLVPITVTNIKSGNTLLSGGTYDFFVTPSSKENDINQDLKDFVEKHWNVPAETVTFDVHVLHEYYRLPLDQYNQPDGTVEKIWLTDAEAAANDIPYLFSDYDQALMRAQD